MWVALIVLLIYFAILCLVAAVFVYPFRTPLFFSPGFLGASQESFELLNPETGLKLRGWWSDVPDAKVVVVCAHGYMMNRAELSPMAVQYSRLGISSVFFDFRAHGSSQGRKSGFGLREVSDLKAVVEAARERFPGAKIICHGSSMGAACSSFTASMYPELVDGLILDSAYDRLSDAVDGWWRFIGGKTAQFVLAPAVYLGIPIAGMNPLAISVSSYLAKVSVPTLLLHGERDTLAEPKAAKTNFEALRGEKEIVWFPGRNHSEARWEDPEQYAEAIDGFLRRHFLNG